MGGVVNKNQVVAVSVSLQELSAMISKFLEAQAGEEVAFTLVVATGGVLQYASNAQREDSAAMLKALMEAFQGKRAAIPAHYNPDLKI